MKWEGNLRKMKAAVGVQGDVSYEFAGADGLQPIAGAGVNGLVGRDVTVTFCDEIRCVVSGDRISKTFGEGMSYQAFMESPLATPSILRPELSRIHEGIALRDEAWEREHHLQPHLVYLSWTSHVKVGVTRATQVPTRWVDQGATGAMVVAHAPYRQLAGEMEVALKAAFSDKTSWRAMLREHLCDPAELEEAREEAFEVLGVGYESFFDDDEHVTCLSYPVAAYPAKVTSVKLDRTPKISGRLAGVKGQYLIWEDGRVMNVRSHAGYRVRIEA